MANSSKRLEAIWRVVQWVVDANNARKGGGEGELAQLSRAFFVCLPAHISAVEM